MVRSASHAPLSAFTVLHSSEPSDVHRSATELMNRHKMRLGSRSAFEADIRHATAGGLGLLYFRYGTEVEITPTPLESFIAVHMPLTGRLAFAHRAGSAIVTPGMGAVISATDSVHMRWSDDLQLLVLRVSREILERKLYALTGERVARPVVFDPVFGANGSGATLAATVRTLQSSIDDFGADGLPAVLATEFEELVLSMLLLEHPHSHSDGIVRHMPTSPSKAVRLATEYVRERYAQPITVDELARAAHVSERSLYEAFRREFGQSPMAWVRRFRLEQARAALLAADPGAGATVSSIAADSGFGHVGRFASEYRARYGESPARTLRQ